MNVDEIVGILALNHEYMKDIKSQMKNDFYRKYTFKPEMLPIYEVENDNLHDLINKMASNLKHIIENANDNDMEEAIKIIIACIESNGDEVSPFKDSDEYFMLISKYLDSTIGLLADREKALNNIKKKMEE